MNDEETVFMVHGILSNGAWHRSVSGVLWPFFQTQSIRYREYHAFGPINIFFWPWAIVLAAILGWFATRELSALADFRFVASALAAISSFALIASWRSGLARIVPWLVVGGFWLGAIGDGRLVWLALAVSLFICVVGYLRTRRERRNSTYWLLAIMLATASCVAGWGATKFEPAWVLVLPAILLGGYLIYCEWAWRGWNWTMLIPAAVVAVAAAIVMMGFDDRRSWIVFGAILVLMVFLESREVIDGKLRGIWWLVFVVGIAGVCAAIWPSLDQFPGWGYLAAFMLLTVGWYEPERRINRASERIVQQVESLTNWARNYRTSWIAHSLGTYLTGVAFQTNNIRLERLLLVSGAISEDYPWGPLMEGRAPTIKQIRNEHGTVDAVIQLLWSGGSWLERQKLGGAGWVGVKFDPPPEIHQVSNYRQSCVDCAATGIARVHNYRLGQFAHSTAFLRAPHARDQWLPYLWGHCPVDVRTFYEKCLELQQSRSQGRRAYRAALAGFLQETYNWHLLPGGTKAFSASADDEVGAAARRLDRAYPDVAPLPSERVRRMAAVLVSRFVVLAINERDRPAKDRDRELIAWLNPSFAIQLAATNSIGLVAQSLRDGQCPKKVKH